MARIGVVLEGDVRHTLVAALAKAGYEVEVASGQDRLEALRDRDDLEAYLEKLPN